MGYFCWHSQLCSGEVKFEAQVGGVDGYDGGYRYADRLNFAILIVSLTAPYQVITRIVSAINPMSIAMVERLLFVESLKNTYLAFAAINAMAIIASLFQINFRKKVEKSRDIVAEAVPI